MPAPSLAKNSFLLYSRMATALKSKVLEFEVVGESTLPSVCVLRPALKDSTKNPLLQFRRVWVGRSVTLPLVLLNDGNVPAEVRGQNLLFFFPKWMTWKILNRKSEMSLWEFWDQHFLCRSRSTCWMKTEFLPWKLDLTTTSAPSSPWSSTPQQTQVTVKDVGSCLNKWHSCIQLSLEFVKKLNELMNSFSWLKILLDWLPLFLKEKKRFCVLEENCIYTFLVEFYLLNFKSGYSTSGSKHSNKPFRGFI